MIIRLISCLGLFLVTGCAKQVSQDVLTEKDHQLARMQQRLVEVQESASQARFSFDRDIADLKSSYREETEQQTELIKLLRSQVETLRAEKRALLLDLSNIQAAQTGVQAVQAPPPPPLPLAQLEEAVQEVSITLPEEQGFPVVVESAKGRKVITGSHKVSRFVENGEEVKDRFGRWRADGDWVQEDVNQYGYEVEFAINNPSRQPRQVTARAGLTSHSITLEPGETREGITLIAARGSGLWLLSEGRSLKLDVDYDEDVTAAPAP